MIAAAPRGRGGTRAVTTAGIAGATEDHPGRWLGGAIGALVAGTVALGAAVVGQVTILPPEAITVANAVAVVCALGIPVGFGLGRQLFPSARSQGWRHALAVGLAFGWTAPFLGAIEILAAGLLVPWAKPVVGLGPDGIWFLPIALPVSLIAAPVTLPVGVAWGLLARAVPPSAVRRAQIAPPWDRLGVRHVILASVLWVLVAEVVTIASRSGS